MPKDSKVTNDAKQTIGVDELKAQFDAVLLTGGAEQSRDLPVPGRELDGVHFAMEFLPQQNKVVAGDKVKGQIVATGKHVIVIGGGDTGSDCVGTSNRHGASSVTQFELLPQPPDEENKPAGLALLADQAAHQLEPRRRLPARVRDRHQGTDRRQRARSRRLKTVRVEWQGGKMIEVPGSEQILQADLVLLAMGFVSPVASVLDAFGVERDNRGNAKAGTEGAAAIAPTSTRSSPPATCAAARAWWSGPSVKAARPRVRSTSSCSAAAICRASAGTLARTRCAHRFVLRRGPSCAADVV